MGAQFSLHFLF